MYIITEGSHTLQTALRRRSEHLKKLIRETGEALDRAPAGRLRAAHNHGHMQYYWREEKKERLGRYLTRKDAKLIRRLAQKEYDEKVMRCASKEYRLLQKLLELLDAQCLEDIYTELNDLRKPHVSPRAFTEEMLVQKWQSEEYPHKPVPDDESMPEYLTDRGERVRSKSELMLANKMNSYGIPYQYEYPLQLQGFGLIHPDFRILLVRSGRVVYLEHNGMMSDPMYLDSFMKRQAAYIRNGMIPGRDVIFTFESADHPLDSKVINRLCEELASM